MFTMDGARAAEQRAIRVFPGPYRKQASPGECVYQLASALGVSDFTGRLPRSGSEIERVIRAGFHAARRRRELDALDYANDAVGDRRRFQGRTLLVELCELHLALRVEHEVNDHVSLEIFQIFARVVVALTNDLPVVHHDLADDVHRAR